ncbi:hypothetical protein E1B28_010109 [Marasmius oreades]|uniref:SEC7 domain-containing protein n=1 Tax=Marasmius oreades TaxID=181124 RepID=A0A9P7RWM4_9AGAR|nr:uncharacterized protein E1B28_010109 [Marasmius oreades]KAG7091050.1 hypothetical protein E1B28_010109 [Marasmius oreades]
MFSRGRAGSAGASAPGTDRLAVPESNGISGGQRPVGPRDIRQKQQQQQLSKRVSRTDLDFEQALRQEGTVLLREGIDVNELGTGLLDTPPPQKMTYTGPTTPVVVPPTPGSSLPSSSTKSRPQNDEDGENTERRHQQHINRRSMYRSPGSSSSPDLATLLRKQKERDRAAGRERSPVESPARESRDKSFGGLSRVLSPSPPPSPSTDRIIHPLSPSPLPGARFQPNRTATTVDSSNGGWVLAGSSLSPAKSKSSVRAKASTFIGKMLGGNTVRERAKTDASQQTPVLLDAFTQQPPPPVPPMPPAIQTSTSSSPIADVFTGGSLFTSSYSSSTSKPLPPINPDRNLELDDIEEPSMVIVEKPASTPSAASRGNFPKRRSMSATDTDLKSVVGLPANLTDTGLETVKGRNKLTNLSRDGSEDSVLRDFKGQLSSHLDVTSISRPLDLRYPTSSASLPSTTPTESRRNSQRSKTDSVLLEGSEKPQPQSPASASASSLFGSSSSRGLGPPSLRLRTDEISVYQSLEPAPIVPPRSSSLQTTPIRSTSGPASSTGAMSPPNSPFKQNLSPSRARNGHSSFHLPPPSSTRGLKSRHRPTASSSEPSLIPANDEPSRNITRGPASSQYDIPGGLKTEVRFPSRPTSLARGGSEVVSTEDFSTDMEARGQELATKCWNEDEEFLAKDKIAEWLGGTVRINKLTLQHYMDFFDFKGLSLDNAFRRLCAKLYLKGETQQVDRLLEEFSRRYWDCNPGGVYGSTNIVHAVTYSLLLLNTDLHVADLANRMSRNQFVRNTLTAIQMQLQPSSYIRTSSYDLVDDSSSFKGSHSGDGDQNQHSNVRSKRSDSITSWNSISRETVMSSPAISLTTTQVTTPGGPYGSDSSSMLGASQDSKSPNLGYGRAWEATMENLLKDMYNAVKNQQILLPMNAAGRASTSSINNVIRNRSLRGQQPDRLMTLKRGSIRGIQSIMGGQPGVSPYSSNSSIDGRVSPSPSFAASTHAHELFGSSSSFLSPTLGFASNLTHTIIKETQEDDDRSDHSNGSTSSDISITDEELALLGAPWAKEGMLCRKQYWESTGKRAKDKGWLDVFVVIQKGELNMFTFGENGAGGSSVVGGGNWLSNANAVGTIHLAHSLAHALPSPGYNRQRPYCMVLTLSNGGVYFFQAGTEELVNEWVSTCNYWAARTSKEPLAGGVSNMEYGWNRVSEVTFHGRSQSGTESMRDNDAASVKSGKSSRSKFSGWREGAATVRTAQSPWIDRIVINDWKPPMPPSVSSFHDEETQLDALRKHVKSMKRDLQRHNELREPMSALYQPRSNSAVKAQSNWEKKSQYLLTEIVKYDSYIDSLQAAMSLRLKRRGEKALEMALNGDSKDAKRKRKSPDEDTIHEKSVPPDPPPTISLMHKRETAQGGGND